MGIKRLGRKRLHAIEKLGILKDISASDAIKNAIVSATQHRQGQQVITDIVLDLGTSKGTILTGGITATSPIGESGGLATICTFDADVFLLLRDSLLFSMFNFFICDLL